MNFFGFMDETGILSNDPKQPYFALGLLRLYNTSELMQKIITIKAKHNGIIKEKLENKELKFNSLSQNKHLQMYKDIVELCLNSHFYFSVFLIERDRVNRQNKTTWNMQLSFAKEHIRQNCKEEHSIAIIADYLNKPRNEPHFEDEIRKLKQVFNACMLESDSSIFVQIVDIFVGAVVYRYKYPHQNKQTDRNPKMQLVQFIEKILEQNYSTYKMETSGNYTKDKTLKGNFTIFGKEQNFYFSVFEKKD